MKTFPERLRTEAVTFRDACSQSDSLGGPAVVTEPVLPVVET